MMRDVPSVPATLAVEARLERGSFLLDVAFAGGPGVTVLFGPSGAGKTTILNLIAGLDRPDTGRITLGNTVLVDTTQRVWVSPHRRRVGLVFQDAQLFPHMTVSQNIGFGRWFARSGGALIDTDGVIGVLGLEALLNRRPFGLSGGEKQRVALARALLAAPAVLLMDEPLAGLDDDKRREILPLIESVRDGFRVPILYVTHRIDEVERLADTVVKLDRGRVVGVERVRSG